MNTVFLTSNIDVYYKDDNGNQIARSIPNTNLLYQNLRDSIVRYRNALYVASDPNNYDINDKYANLYFESLDMCIPFENYDILDNRTIDNADQMVKDADLIILSGGHVPTQNKFFHDINLSEHIRMSNAVIVGISAGSMNCATSVYCVPELSGEATLDFKGYYEGLGLTEINIMPHITDMLSEKVDNVSIMHQYILPDSVETSVLAIPDGSYVMLEKNSARLFGEGYMIRDGKMTQLSNINEVVNL